MAVKKTDEKPITKEIKKPKKTGRPLELQGKPVSYCVYIGPSIRGIIQSGTIYEGTREETEKKLQGEIEKYPLIKKLISTDKTLVQDRIKVRRAGNLLNKYYRELAGNYN